MKTRYERDDATFADALSDVRTAIQHVQKRFPEVRETGRYLLVGHGFGALLATNALMATRGREWGITPPRALLGVNGVYDLRMLHRGRREFEELTRRVIPEEGRWEGEDGAGAVGWKEGRWAEAWGRMGKGEGEGPGMAKGKRTLLLAHSREDRLVGFAQAEALKGVFDARVREEGAEIGLPSQSQISCELLEIKGRHNECWENGRELARAIREGMGRVLESASSV